MSLTTDIHALQTIPPSLINRDDTGAPKSAIFGGVPRQRVSSQSWKRAIRTYFKDTVDISSVGQRTKRVADVIAKKVVELAEDKEHWTLEEAATGIENLFKAAKIKLVEPKAAAPDDDEIEQKKQLAQTGYLLFLSPRQIEHAAQQIIEKDGEKFSKAEAQKILDQDHSIDIAMFGRMLADAPSYNVDAAVQVQHALGIHESEPEFDYFTAVDDVVQDEEESGAGMIGSTQMMSSTLYRFASIDQQSLTENLGDEEAAIEATVAFIRAFIESLPTGKQNSFAHNTLPELIYVAVRDTRSVSLVNAFEEPVTATATSGRRQAGAEKMAAEERDIETKYGFTPRRAFVIGLGDLATPFEDLATVTTLPELDGLVRTALMETE